MKICTQCNQEKQLSSFHRRPERAGGYSSSCKDCFNRKGRQKYHSDPRRKSSQIASAEAIKLRNRMFIWKYLQDHPCLDCGESDPVVLDFDHVRGVKVCNISAMVTQKATLKRIAEEIEKCEVRCANCHRRATARRGNWWQIKYSVASQIVMSHN